MATINPVSDLAGYLSGISGLRHFPDADSYNDVDSYNNALAWTAIAQASTRNWAGAKLTDPLLRGHVSSIQLTIKRWSAWMPGIATRQDWRDWQQGRKKPLADENPAVREIPPMLRRRLSPLGKMALSVAWPLLRETPALPSVFCSRHGELERTVSMLQNLATGEALSPTHFSLSVHNAIGGVYSIAREDRSPISSIAVGNEGLSTALLETRLILGEQGVDEALCVLYDAPPPTVYHEFSSEPQWPYAAAFVIGLPDSGPDAEIALSLSPCGLEDVVSGAALPVDPGEPQTLSFLRFILAEPRAELLLPCRGDYWHWSTAELVR